MKSYKILLTFLAIFLLAPSCADLDELSPVNSIPADQAINNRATAMAAVNGIYDAIQTGNGSLMFDGWLALPQFFSDEAEATGTFPTRLEFGNLNVFPANSTMASVFTDLYNAINIANNVIELVPVVEELDAGEISDFVAQAKFIRAQCYLHLVNLWQEVPLVLIPTRETGEVLNIPRNSVDEIYAQIISDFTEAAQNIAAETGPFHASKQAANAFLARVALYRGNWAEALAKAETVLGADFDLTAMPFLDDQIYSLGFTSTDGNVLNFFYGPEDFGGRYSIGPSMAIINAFEDGDLRKAQTLDLESASVPFGVKYPSFDAGISGTATDPYFLYPPCRDGLNCCRSRRRNR